METYGVEIKCHNCHKINWINGIPNGTTIEDFAGENLCRHCGCEILQRKREEEKKKSAKNKKDKPQKD